MFQRVKESFDCEYCGIHVEGDGYTDHCPQCLWGKHIDITPGDRAHTCGGLMKPIHVVTEGGEMSKIFYRCQICQYEYCNKIADEDSRDVLIQIMENFAFQEAHGK